MASSRRATAAKAAHRTTPKPAANAPPHDPSMLDRLKFFSDAVFAIVLTLLVLELKPPEAHSAQDLWAGLARMSSHFIAFALTFAVISIFWTAHMSNLRALKQFDWPAAVMNLLHLFPICLLPFVSSLLADARFGPAAWTVYSVVLIWASTANIALVLTIWRGGGRLVSGVPAGGGAYRVSRAAAPGIAFGLGLVAIGLGHVNLARLCWLLIPVLFMVFQLLLKPKPA
ncbi:TMEM175 family protein [soil metagenome]